MKGISMKIETNFNKRYSENGKWFSDAAPMALGMNGFNGKWHVIFFTAKGEENISYYQTKEGIINGGFTETSEQLIADATSLFYNRGEYYNTYGVTYAYFTADTNVTFTIKFDGQGTLYINNSVVEQSNYKDGNVSVTYTFKKGWNKIEVTHNEGYGGDRILFSQKISSFTNCKGIDCSMIGTKSAKYVGISSTPNVFKSFTWKENT